MAYILFAVTTLPSHLMLFKTKLPTALYKNAGECGPDDRVFSVRLRDGFAALIRHERRNDEVL